MLRRPTRRFDFSGGALCLDFANTLADRPVGRSERLAGWPDLIAWGAEAGLVSRRKAPRAAAARAFSRAIALRESLYRVFAAVAADRVPPRADLERLNEVLAAAMRHAHLSPHGRAFTWSWTGDEPPVDRILWPVARSAAELLVSPARADVRECASETCGWLFIDRSPTRRRRWCSMRTCGNREKARRFYRKQRRAPHFLRSTRR